MEAFVQRMIKEHGELKVRIAKLEAFIYSDRSNSVNKADFANMCMQLSHMRQYEQCLAARLENQNVIEENGSYFCKVAEIKEGSESSSTFPVEECPDKDGKAA